MALAGLLGGGVTSLAALYRMRGQGKIDTATAREINAKADSIESESISSLAEKLITLSSETRKAQIEQDEKISDIEARRESDLEKARMEFEDVRFQLKEDIRAKDILIRNLQADNAAIKADNAEMHSNVSRLNSDFILVKQKLGEWRAYAMGLYHMLVALRPDQTPPPPPDTGPLKP